MFDWELAMSFSERRYEIQSAGDPIFGSQHTPWLNRMLWRLWSQISGHGATGRLSKAISPFRKKHARLPQ